LPGSPRLANSSTADFVDLRADAFLRLRPAAWCLFLRLVEEALVFEAMAGFRWVRGLGFLALEATPCQRGSTVPRG